MPLRDLIDILGTLNTIKRQQEASDLAFQHEKTGAFNQFTSLLPNIRDPKELEPLIKQFSQVSGQPEDAFRNLAQAYQPTSGVLSAGQYQDYIRSQVGTPQGQQLQRETAFVQGTGRGAGAGAESSATADVFNAGLGPELQRQFAARTVGGMSAGTMALDTNLANQPIEQLAAGNQIKLGTRLSAGQQQQGLIAGEQINQQDREVMSRTGLGLLEIRARGLANDHTNTLIENIRDRYNKTLTDITTHPKTEAAKQALIDQLRTDYDLLNGPGSFDRTYPDIRKQGLSPGVLQRILSKTGP